MKFDGMSYLTNSLIKRFKEKGYKIIMLEEEYQENTWMTRGKQK